MATHIHIDDINSDRVEMVTGLAEAKCYDLCVKLKTF